MDESRPDFSDEPDPAEVETPTALFVTLLTNDHERPVFANGVSTELPHDLPRLGQVTLRIDLRLVGAGMTEGHLSGFEAVASADLGGRGVAELGGRPAVD